MIYFLFPRRAIMALVKNKLSPVDQFLNTSISVLYVRISKLITDMAILSKMEQDLTYQYGSGKKDVFKELKPDLF